MRPPGKSSTEILLQTHSHNQTLNHLAYDEQTDVWLTQNTSATPTITVNTSVCLRAYQQFGIFTEELRRTKAAINVVAKADTGASVCVAGTDLMHAVGITRLALAPTKVRLWSAENNMLHVLGGIFLDIHVISRQTGEAISTRQLVYIAEGVKVIFPE